MNASRPGREQTMEANFPDFYNMGKINFRLLIDTFKVPNKDNIYEGDLMKQLEFLSRKYKKDFPRK